jgi:hypothetical protein
MAEAGSDLRQRIKKRLSDLTPTPRVVMRLADSKTATDRRNIVVEHVTVVAKAKTGQEVLSEPEYSYKELKQIVKSRFSHEMSGVAGRGTDRATVVEGMDVSTEQVVQTPTDINYYDYEHRDVPGGCHITVDNGSGGTLGTYAFDGDTYSYVFVTAGHLLDEDGEGVYQETKVIAAIRLGM